VTSRLFLRLLAAFALVIAVATATLDFSIRRAWENSLRQEIDRSLRQKTLMFANRVNTDREHTLQDVVSEESHAAGARGSPSLPPPRAAGRADPQPASATATANQATRDGTMAGSGTPQPTAGVTACRWGA